MHSIKPRLTMISPGLVYSLLAVLVMLTIVSLLLISKSGWHIAEQHSSLVREAEMLRTEASLFHLWFEELVQGDATIVEEKVWFHLKQAEMHAGALIHGGRNSDHAFLPMEDSTLQEETSLFLILLYELQVIAHQRFERSAASTIGSANDQEFDTAFNRLLLQSDKVNGVLGLAIDDEMSEFQILIFLMLGLTVAGVVGSAFLLSFYGRSRRHVETKLRNSEASLRQAQEIAQVGSWHWDVQRGRSKFSEEACRIFGINPENNQGSYISFLRHVHCQDRRKVKADVLAAMHSQQAEYNGEFRIIRPDGEIRTVHARGAAEYNSSGSAACIIGTVRDITERKQAEEQLKQSFEALQEKTDRLERFQKITVGREMDMLKLKEEVNTLMEQLGQPKKYQSPDRIRDGK